MLNNEMAEKLGVTERIVATDLYRAKQDGRPVPPSPYRAEPASGPSPKVRPEICD
jgi:hypothetical protein